MNFRVMMMMMISDDGHEVFERDLSTDHAHNAFGIFWAFCLQFLIISMKFNVSSLSASSYMCMQRSFS